MANLSWRPKGARRFFRSFSKFFCLATSYKKGRQRNEINHCEHQVTLRVPNKKGAAADLAPKRRRAAVRKIQRPRERRGSLEFRRPKGAAAVCFVIVFACAHKVAVIGYFSAQKAHGGSCACVARPWMASKTLQLLQ